MYERNEEKKWSGEHNSESKCHMHYTYICIGMSNEIFFCSFEQFSMCSKEFGLRKMLENKKGLKYGKYMYGKIKLKI